MPRVVQVRPVLDLISAFPLAAVPCYPMALLLTLLLGGTVATF
jgi:hypothetical protein